ncbi:hypothetical protein A4X13_0g9426, partial [Tilletia indica]
MTASGFKAHSAWTGGTTTIEDTYGDGADRAARRRDKSIEKTGSRAAEAGPVVQDLHHNGNGTEGPSRRRGGEATTGDLPVKVK